MFPETSKLSDLFFERKYLLSVERMKSQTEAISSSYFCAIYSWLYWIYIFLWVFVCVLWMCSFTGGFVYFPCRVIEMAAARSPPIAGENTWSISWSKRCVCRYSETENSSSFKLEILFSTWDSLAPTLTVSVSASIVVNQPIEETHFTCYVKYLSILTFFNKSGIWLFR